MSDTVDAITTTVRMTWPVLIPLAGLIALAWKGATR